MQQPDKETDTPKNEKRGKSLRFIGAVVYDKENIHRRQSREKIFFFDIDGTLTKPLTAEIPPSTVKALHGLAEQGHFIALATGRLQADAWQVAQGLGISSVVSDGGMGITIKAVLIRHGSRSPGTVPPDAGAH